ncbi:MFS transporter [Nigerium massiliense]|uniref:MFS transporter n=1 Tax=Nigerium massiliense TaxID=1522317 RepID=UPI00058F707D|nr:MFS transporter [Nigerium massiliense]
MTVTAAPQKTYLNWGNKIGYGSGDVAGNVVYAFLSAFLMIYLTDQMGLNAGVIGTLMMIAQMFNGVTDIAFGALLDRTRSRMGKARPWMLWGYVGCAVTLVASFAIPASLSETMQYVWFFIAYSLLNSVFFTANNIAYGALTALITKNAAERVQMGSIRFMFAFTTSMLIQTFTVRGVQALGGGAEGWRWIAIIYAIIGLVVNTISVFSVKELSAEELAEGIDEKAAAAANYTFKEGARILLGNKYYMEILLIYLIQQIYTATINMGIYFMTWVLLDANLLGVFSWAINIPMIIGLLFTPILVSRFAGMYKINSVGYVIATIGRLGVVAAAYMHSIPLMLAFSALASLGMSPLQGTLNALIAEASDYSFLRSGKRIDGMMFSCTTLGVKIGGGIGTALAGWLLAAGGYDGSAATQSPAAITMLYLMYLWIPAVASALIWLILTRLNVEQANRKLRAQLIAA